MSDFPTNRSLLNPKFEGYKLSLLEQDQHVSNYPLNSRPTQANVSGRTRTPLSFEEVQSRITHNHLFISYDRRSALYVDGDYCIVGVELGSDLSPIFSVLCELPRPIGSSETHLEYPTAVSVPGFWLVSDGTGLLFVLVKDTVTAQYGLLDELNSTFEPFRIHAAYKTEAGTARCLISSHSSTKNKESRHGSFNLRIVEIPLKGSNSDPEVIKVIWHGKGEDLPIYTRYDSERNVYCILSSSVYANINDAPPPLPYVPSADELAPIPRKEENLDIPNKPPPYSWTQTTDSVTIAFALPSNIMKDAIHVTLTAKTLSLLVKHELPSPTPLPRYSLKQLWDSINTDASFWTWDRAADKHFGLLTLHLDKRHEGTRWTHVFSSVGTKPASAIEQEEDIEVPETLDPSELVNIRESLEKYTSALVSGEDASGLGLGTGVPSLAENELDESVDGPGAVGRRFSVTWLSEDGSKPAWANGEGVQSYLLSVPIPGLDDDQTERPSIVIRGDIDGLLFVSPSDSGANATWTHTATFSALAFVLASKRDTRFTFHASSSAVLSFESGTSLGGGNVFIYYGPGNKGKKEVWAKQSVLKISGGSAGPLMGVGALTLPSQEGQAGTNNNVVLLCLCENELVVVKNIL